MSSQLRKDLATPRSADQGMRKRQGQRQLRAAKSSGRAVVLHVSRAMRAMCLQSLPNGCTKGLRFMWHRVRQPRIQPVDLTHVKCGVCWTTNSDYCPCGWEFAASHNKDALSSFGSFVFSPRNPILRAWDPEDQRELLKAMKNACAQPAWNLLPVEKKLRGVAALCSLAGFTGRASTVERAGTAAASLCWDDLSTDIGRIIAAKLPVYRGGQRPGNIAPDQVAAKIKEIDSEVGDSLAASLLKLSSQWCDDQQVYVTPSISSRREGILEIIGAIQTTVQKSVVLGLSRYKGKRIVEMLLLAAYGGLAGLYAVPEDLRVVHGFYLLPDNSMTALNDIFPCARSEAQKREALRLLQKTLKPCHFDVAVLVAMLCFWTEEKNGKIHYLAD